DTERRYLAAALRCREDANLSRYLALELGCAVEWSLPERIVRPLRVRVARGELTLPEAVRAADRRLRAKVAEDQGPDAARVAGWLR
ncbi:MAG: hypothetical protein ACJ8AW_14635, partial [Rhodopila sp.]